jgi:hypothetical protein
MQSMHEFRTSPWVIGVFGALGAALATLAFLFPLAVQDRWWAIASVSLPAGGLGLWLLTRVPLLARTRIRLDEFGIELRIPVWAGGWLRRGPDRRIGWDEITALSHARRPHFPLGPLGPPLPVEEYRLHTVRGQVTITKNICPRPEQILALVAARTALPVQEAEPPS